MIHKTAIVDKNAKISVNVEIGPYSVIGPDVEIGESTIIHSHVNLTGYTKIGKNNQIYPFSSIGTPPQFHDQLFQLNALTVESFDVPVLTIFFGLLSTSLHSSD